MFVANDQDKSVLAADAHHKITYTCPGCGQSVILRQGQMRLSHFAHHAGADCHLFSEGETKAHLAGKTRIFNWCRQNHLAVKLEAYLLRLKQRPDILVYWHHHWTAIEFQCSPISFEKLVERTQGYRTHGYKVWWILGPTYLAHKLTLEKVSKFAYFQKSLSLFVSFYDPQNDQFLIRHHITQDLFGKLKWQDYVFNPSKKAFTELFHQGGKQKPNFKQDSYREAVLLQHQLLGRYSDARLKRVQFICYTHHLNLAGCPWIVHDQNFKLPTGKKIPLEVKIEFLLKLQLWQKQFVSYSLLATWYREVTEGNPFQLANVTRPQLNIELNFQQFVQNLLSDHVLKTVQKQYQIMVLPRWYTDITQKLRHFPD